MCSYLFSLFLAGLTKTASPGISLRAKMAAPSFYFRNAVLCANFQIKPTVFYNLCFKKINYKGFFFLTNGFPPKLTLHYKYTLLSRLMKAMFKKQPLIQLPSVQLCTRTLIAIRCRHRAVTPELMVLYS